jgi:hypothetical protein
LEVLKKGRTVSSLTNIRRSYQEKWFSKEGTLFSLEGRGNMVTQK